MCENNTALVLMASSITNKVIAKTACGSSRVDVRREMNGGGTTIDMDLPWLFSSSSSCNILYDNLLAECKAIVKPL